MVRDLDDDHDCPENRENRNRSLSRTFAVLECCFDVVRNTAAI